MWRKFLFLLVGMLVAGIALLWFSKSTWLPQWNAELADQAQAYKAEGLALGQQHDQDFCLAESLTRFNQCSGFACTVNHGILLKSCLQEAAPSYGFCDDVPAFQEKPSEDDKSWARDYCWQRDVRGDGCKLLMRQQQYFCSQQRLSQ